MKHKSIFYFLTLCILLVFLSDVSFAETTNECVTNYNEAYHMNSSCCSMSDGEHSGIKMLLIVLAIPIAPFLMGFTIFALGNKADDVYRSRADGAERTKERSSKHNNKVYEMIDRVLSGRTEYELVYAQRWDKEIPIQIPYVLYGDDGVAEMFRLNPEGVVLDYKNAGEEKITICSYKDTNVTIHGDAIEHVWFTKSSDFVARMNDICDDFIQKKEEEELNRIN